jgi:primosomal protein N' (replication factor Y)
LDGDVLLRRESLRASEEALRRWFNAASLVRPAKDGGVVVITADDAAAVGALLRWDAPGFAERELHIRSELGLPPSVRIASVTGDKSAVEAFVDSALAAGPEKPGTVRVVGPAPLAAGSHGHADPPEDYRTLIFFPYGAAGEVTRALRAVKASNSAKRATAPVQVRLDGLDVI